MLRGDEAGESNRTRHSGVARFDAKQLSVGVVVNELEAKGRAFHIHDAVGTQSTGGDGDDVLPLFLVSFAQKSHFHSVDVDGVLGGVAFVEKQPLFGSGIGGVQFSNHEQQ